MRTSTEFDSIALRSASSGACCIALRMVEVEMAGVFIFRSNVVLARISSLSFARRARASLSTSTDAQSALAWMVSTTASSLVPTEGRGPFIASRTAASQAA